jgi:hypothetical protein
MAPDQLVNPARVYRTDVRVVLLVGPKLLVGRSAVAALPVLAGPIVLVFSR